MKLGRAIFDPGGFASGNRFRNSAETADALDFLDVSGSTAARESAQIQTDAAKEAADISAASQIEMFGKGQAATAPWRESGGRALGMLSDIYGVNRGGGNGQASGSGFGGADIDGSFRGSLPGVGQQRFTNDGPSAGGRDAALERFRNSPAYQNRMNASREGALSAVSNTRDANPRMLDELRRVSSGIADRGFTDYTRGLQSMAGVGQGMANKTAGQSANLGQSLGQTYQNQAQQVGSANAQAAINQANQTSNTLNQAASMYGSYRGASNNNSGGGSGGLGATQAGYSPQYMDSWSRRQ